jgi:acetyl-CoA carboxylase biotin carboxyl carrier protein
MTYKEIQDLIKLVVRLELSELKLRDGEFELSVRTKEFSKVKSAPAPSVISMTPPSAQPVSAPAPATQPASSDDGGQEATAGLFEIKSPIVGTFYRSSSPDKPPFAKVGDVIKSGDVVCIVEAMKLFNEIEAEVGGKIVKVLIEDATPVEYDQTLFLVDPKG